MKTPKKQPRRVTRALASVHLHGDIRTRRAAAAELASFVEDVLIVTSAAIGGDNVSEDLRSAASSLLLRAVYASGAMRELLRVPTPARPEEAKR